MKPVFAWEQETNIDSKELGKALDYFSGQKYHEALIIMKNLDKRYELNPRFKAYIGICYYHELNYELACKYLDEAMPHLEVYAPHERSIYYNIAAESHFKLEEYEKSIPLYEKQFLVCYDNEKGDILYQLGFCYMRNNSWQNAADCFSASIAYYKSFSVPDRKPRIIQMEKMIRGCEKNLE